MGGVALPQGSRAGVRGLVWSWWVAARVPWALLETSWLEGQLSWRRATLVHRGLSLAGLSGTDDLGTHGPGSTHFLPAASSALARRHLAPSAACCCPWP